MDRTQQAKIFALAIGLGLLAAIGPKACTVAMWVNQQYDLATGQALINERDALKKQLQQQSAPKPDAPK